MAIEIPISSLYPVDGSNFPANDKDSTTKISYTLWEVGDTASFSEALPVGVTQASDLTLKIIETTPGVSQKHKWQAVVILVRPGTHTITAATVTETFSTEYTSSATTNQSAIRNLAISDGNDINTTAMQSGDLISVQLSRIAASGTEDSNAIRVPDIRLVVGSTSSALTACTNGVGRVITAVLDICNDANQSFVTATQIISWINLCWRDLAKNGYWEASDFMNVTVDTYEYDMTADATFDGILRPLFVKVNNSTLDEVAECSSLEEYYEEMGRYGTGSTPYRWYWDGMNLLLTPTPSATTSNAVLIGYTKAQDDRGCTSNDTFPQINQAHEDVFVHYCLWQRARRDFTNPKQQFMVADQENAYKQARADLMNTKRANSFRARPYGYTV